MTASIAITVDDLRTKFRREVDDALVGATDDDRLWKDDEIVSFANEALDEWARVTRALQETILLNVVAAEPTVELPTRVLDIQDVYLETSGVTVMPKNANNVDTGVVADYNGVPLGFQDSLHTGSGTPRCYVRDYDNGDVLRLIPTPILSETLKLQATVTIEDNLDEGDDLPRMGIKDQRIVLMYMKYLAYGNQDADTYDLQRSQTFYSQFEFAAGERELELRRYRRTPGAVKFSWT